MSSAVHPPSRRRTRAVTLLAMVLALVGTFFAAPSLAVGSVSVSIAQSTPAAQPSGSEFVYQVSVDCVPVDTEPCLVNGQITIPLGDAAVFDVEAPAPLPAGVEAMSQVGSDVVIDLADIPAEGGSVDIEFTITPPTGTTQNGTSWTLQPTLTGDGGVNVVGDSVTSSAILQPPDGETPAGLISKLSLGPEVGTEANRLFNGTYAGPWGAGATDGQNVILAVRAGDVEGVYVIQASTSPRTPVEWSMTDDMPCSDNSAGAVYTESTDGLCQNPAFNPTVIDVLTRTILPTSYAAQAVLTDGSTVDLPQVRRAEPNTDGNDLARVQFTVPTSVQGQVARLVFPRTVGVDAAVQSVQIGGYVSADRVTDDVIRNKARAEMYMPGAVDSAQSLETLETDLIVVAAPTLSPAKTASYDAGTNTYRFDLSAGMFLPGPAQDGVVIADLWPQDLPLPSAAALAGVRVDFEAKSGPDGTNLSVAPTIIDNFEGTGRTLIRWTIPADQINAITDGDPGTINILFVDPSGASTLTGQPTVGGTFANEASMFAGENVREFCGAGTASAEDPLDLDGTPATMHCTVTAPLTVPPLPNGPAMLATKDVKGDQDPYFQQAPSMGTVSSDGGSVTYRLSWVNKSAQAATDVVLYDVFPAPGDTGIIESSADTPRGSTFRPELTAIGTLPAGVSVQYSLSANPCRDEVFPNTTNTGCVDDWTATAPADLGAVTAIKIVSSLSYAFDAGFALEVTMATPSLAPSDIAWNAFAAAAKDPNGATLGPVEAPMVGLTGTQARHLTIAKTADTSTANVGDTVTYTVSVTNDGVLPVAGVVATDTMPQGVAFVSATGGGTEAGGAVTWNVGDLDPGESVSYTVVGLVTDGVGGTTQVNRFTATGMDPTDPSAPTIPGDPAAGSFCPEDPGAACAGIEIAPPATTPLGDQPTPIEPLAGDGPLAYTGFSAGQWVQLAIVLTIGGLGALLVGRRRGA